MSEKMRTGEVSDVSGGPGRTFTTGDTEATEDGTEDFLTTGLSTQPFSIKSSVPSSVASVSPVVKIVSVALVSVASRNL
jgi:hypothetical protein